MDEETLKYTCSVCSCEFTEDEGGVDGHFGMLPVAFCPTCFSCMIDMAEQYLDDSEEDNELTEEQEEVFEELKGVRRIVINRQHGGFSLSWDAQIAYLDRSGMVYELENRESRDDTQRYGQRIKLASGDYWSDYEIARDDPVLVDVVREMGEDANGNYADLKVIKIPGNVEWMIDEYDGLEWVAEKHRTWR
jgi:hypothetical protein